MQEFTKVTEEQRMDYYNMKKANLVSSVEKFNESDDLDDLVGIFHDMVVMCRTHGMSIFQVESFLRLRNRKNFNSIYKFNTLMNMYKQMETAVELQDK